MPEHPLTHLNPEHLTLLNDLEQRCFVPPWSEQQLAAYLKGERSVGFLLETENSPAGFALFTTLLDEAELLQIAILPEYRAKGLGQELLAHCHLRLQERGIARLLLEVRASNLPAIRLYQKLGYQQDGIRKGYYPALSGREDAVLMSCDNPGIVSGQ